MPDLILHQSTKSAVDSFLVKPSHAILLHGMAGSGKHSLVEQITTQLLQIDSAALQSYPYYKSVDSQNGIDSVRELQQFATLKVPGTRTISRIASIENIDQMSIEAQNAVLKLLEEPPRGSVIILTANHPEAVLPTISSRVRPIAVATPGRETLKNHLVNQGYEASKVDQALLMSGGRPGLATALLSGDDEHPLYDAARVAREILSKTTFERLLSVDSLAKDKIKALAVLTMVAAMAQAALERVSAAQPDDSFKRITSWQNILSAVSEAEAKLQANSQTKLVLSNLMLRL